MIPYSQLQSMVKRLHSVSVSQMRGGLGAPPPTFLSRRCGSCPIVRLSSTPGSLPRSSSALVRHSLLLATVAVITFRQLFPYSSYSIPTAPSAKPNFPQHALDVTSAWYCPAHIIFRNATSNSHSLIPPSVSPTLRDPSCRDQAYPSAGTQCSKKIAHQVVCHPRAEAQEKAQRVNADNRRV